MPSTPERILEEVWETLKGNHPMMEHMGAQGDNPSARHGISPHIKSPKRLEDLRNGRDGAIEAATTWLRSGKRVPS